MNSFLLTEDRERSIILCLQNEADEMEYPTAPLNKRPCLSSEVDLTSGMPSVAFQLPETEHRFELVTTIATEMTDKEITEGTMMQLQI